jgi:hypothetical protein
MVFYISLLAKAGLAFPRLRSEPVFLNVYVVQKSILRNESASLCSLPGRHDYPIPSRFLAPIDCLKIPAQLFMTTVSEGGCDILVYGVVCSFRDLFISVYKLYLKPFCSTFSKFYEAD